MALPSRLFGDTLVTNSVWNEVTREPRPPEDSRLFVALQAGWLQVVDDPVDEPEGLAAARLDPGERSAIALAVLLNARVLVDERRGRASAKELGLQVLGTLGLLVAARHSGLTECVRPLTDSLLASGYFLAAPLVEHTLAAVGE